MPRLVFREYTLNLTFYDIIIIIIIYLAGK